MGRDCHGSALMGVGRNCRGLTLFENVGYFDQFDWISGEFE